MRHRILSGAALPLIGYALQSPAPPFPVFVIGFAVNGFGFALQVHLSKTVYFYGLLIRLVSQDAVANGYVACLKENPEAKMGILHAVYGEFHARMRFT